MSRNLKTILLVFAIICIISIGLIAKYYIDSFQKEVEIQATKLIDVSKYSLYDKGTCAGSQIKTAMSLYMKDTFTIYVKTGEGKQYIAYTDDNPYKIVNQLDPNWINDVGKFQSQLEFDKEGRVTGIMFSQIK